MTKKRSLMWQYERMTLFDTLYGSFIKINSTQSTGILTGYSNDFLDIHSKRQAYKQDLKPTWMYRLQKEIYQNYTRFKNRFLCAIIMANLKWQCPQ